MKKSERKQPHALTTNAQMQINCDGTWSLSMLRRGVPRNMQDCDLDDVMANSGLEIATIAVVVDEQGPVGRDGHENEEEDAASDENRNIDVSDPRLAPAVTVFCLDRLSKNFIDGSDPATNP
jgi:hypothetical protein